MTDSVAYKNEPDSQGFHHFPGTFGLPLIGRSISFAINWDNAIREHVKKYGHVSKLQFGPFKGVSITHPDHLQYVILDRERNISNEMGWAKPLGIFFSGALALRDFDEHRSHRRIFQTAFKYDAMREYSGLAREIIEGYLSDWERQEEIKFAHEISQPLLDMASRILFGIEDLQGEKNKKLVKAFMDVIHVGTLGIFKVDLPGFKHHTGMKANRFIDKMIAELIPSRRAGNGADCMSYVVKERKEDGELFSNEDLVAHLKFLMFASFDTTSIALTHLVMHLAMDEGLQERVRQEIIDTGKEFLDYDDLENLTLLDNCIMESTRMYPPLNLLFRRTVRDIKLGDYDIPAHTMLLVNLRWAQRSDEYWDAPDVFDPDRWGVERAEHKRHSFSYMAFGGGAHKCLGMHFAKMEAKLFLHRLLLNYKISLPAGYTPEPIAVPLPTVKDGLRIKISRISK